MCGGHGGGGSLGWKRAQELCCVVKKTGLRLSPLWPEFLSAGSLGPLEAPGARFCGHGWLGSQISQSLGNSPAVNSEDHRREAGGTLIVPGCCWAAGLTSHGHCSFPSSSHSSWKGRGLVLKKPSGPQEPSHHESPTHEAGTQVSSASSPSSAGVRSLGEAGGVTHVPPVSWLFLEVVLVDHVSVMRWPPFESHTYNSSVILISLSPL